MTELNTVGRAILAQRELEACQENLEQAEASNSDLRIQAAKRDLEAASRLRLASIRQAREGGEISERSLANALGVEAADLV
jgi:DNA-binding transcriptional regulator YiaG